MSGAKVKSIDLQAGAPSTREKILQAAVPLFAEKGFYGTSIRAIALVVGISKPSLIHHFPTKERLYSEVLSRIATGLLQSLDTDDGHAADEREQLHRFVDRFCAWSGAHEVDARILMRELLDNPQRLSEVHTWHLKPLLDRLMAIIESGRKAGRFRKVAPLSVVINLLGVQHYVMLVRPTLQRIYGSRACQRLDRQQTDLLKRMLDTELL